MLRQLQSIRWSAEQKVFLALGAAHIVSIMLFVARSSDANNPRYWFLLWNALLGALPLVVAWLLQQRLQRQSWRHWPNVLLTILWVALLPNSFYIVSDLIHLHETGEVSLLYDAVLFTSFIMNGFLAGFMSIGLLHRQLLRRLPAIIAHPIVASMFLLCGFAVYLGRFLRWNSWDLLLHPAALLFDISNQFITPASQGLLGTVVSIFFLLVSTYAVGWTLANLLLNKK